MTDDGVLFAGILEMSTATENSIRFSGHTLDKATKAKVTLENYYSNLISQHVERKQRYIHLWAFSNSLTSKYIILVLPLITLSK